ncbi:hypothetical protein PTUN_b0378 [Pseudoalteromonas tunicata]|nr:hypothetical protein PTUN_b0378 [Pseudoalteromonas tunicata]
MYQMSLGIVSLLFYSQVSLAAVQDEINHLLGFVASTHCQYERNGEYHLGPKALAHIEKKYAYYKKEIKTAEDFIALSATKSSMSGREYLVHCPNQTVIPSKTWLLMELKAFRSLKAAQ